jgi:hypothetical protein
MCDGAGVGLLSSNSDNEEQEVHRDRMSEGDRENVEGGSEGGE